MYGYKVKGVCKDADDNGESVECKPHETLCFFTKTGMCKTNQLAKSSSFLVFVAEVDGGGSTYYRNCFVGGEPSCNSYDQDGVKNYPKFFFWCSVSLIYRLMVFIACATAIIATRTMIVLAKKKLVE